MAFVEPDINDLIKIGMNYVPTNSKLYKCFEMITEMYQSGAEWINARREVLNKYSHPDFTNVVQNLGFVLIALLWGKGDMRDTINIALKCGYDTDCTCASAASAVGIIKGYKGLGSEITSLINDYSICGIDIELESESIRDLAEETAKLALKAPNYSIDILNAPAGFEKIKNFECFKLEYPTERRILSMKKT